jgi:hypothetical protein
MRTAVVALIVTSMISPALAQTQRTPPSAYATMPTLRSAFATAPLNPCFRRWFRGADGWRGIGRYQGFSYNPTSPCYSGSPYPSYSALEQPEYPGPNRPRPPGALSLDEDEARSRIEAKGYLNISGLAQDRRGIWRGSAEMNDGRSVDVILDLEGNIYSELSRLYIRIERAPRQKKID